MKKGDLVKIKFSSGEYPLRAMAREFPVDEPGLVIEEAESAAKVFFPSLGKIRSFLKSSLKEVK